MEPSKKKFPSRSITAVTKLYVVLVVLMLVVAGLAGALLLQRAPTERIVTQLQTQVYTQTQTEVRTIGGTATTLVQTQFVTQTVTPTQTQPSSARDTLIVTQVGAHWANIKFGNDPSDDSPASFHIPLIYETLFTYDPLALQRGQYKVIPWLAESYSVSDDGLAWTIKIRNGVKFHSGNTMTADDVVYSFWRAWFADWKRIATYLVAGNARTLSIIPNNIEAVEKIDDYTVRIRLNKTIPFFLYYLTGTFWSIVDSKLVKSQERTLPEFNNAPDYGYTFLNYEFGDAGSGPYKVKRIEMNNRYEYERFEDYWGGPPELNLPKPYFKNIIYVVVNEDADGRFRLLRGDLHIASDFLADTIKALEKYKEVKTYQAEGTSPSGFGLWMHTKTGPLKDWRVRKAIKMALDYSSLDTVAGAGGAVTAQGFFLPGMPGWEENAKYFKGAQVEEANKLLDEAGYPVKEDGWRFHINLYLRPEPRWGLDFTRYGLLIRDQLAKIKINAIPIVLHVAEYYAHVFNPDEPMLWVQPWDTYIMPSLPIYLANYWGRPYAVEHFGFNEETQPEIADVIRRMRELHDQFGEAQTDEERFKILHEIERLNLEYGPWITIGVSTWHIGYNAELQNIFWGPRHLFPAVFYIRWAGS